MPVSRARDRQRGFTLAEVAIVFLIVALLIGGAVLTLSAQTEGREIADTQRTLEQAREAVIGFTVRNGRLPCPAAGGGGAIGAAERFCTNDTGACGLATTAVQTHGRCSNPNGFLPAAMLGIGPIEANPASPNFGLLLDAWLQPVRYSVTNVDATSAAPAPWTVWKLFTAPGALKTNVLASPAVTPDLIVCTASAGAATGVPPALPACGGAALGFPAPAVIFSTGKMQSSLGAVGADEIENLNNDRVFVSRPLTTPINPALPAPNPSFDDLVIWVSPNILYNRLIAAGAI